MIYLLDTNTCIGHLTGRAPVITRRLERLSPTDVALCAVVKGELLFGAHKSARPSENLQRLMTFFAPLLSLPFDDVAAAVYGRIRATLERAGTPIGPNDLLIAAIAVAQGATLVSRNLKEFARVPGLRVESWE